MLKADLFMAAAKRRRNGRVLVAVAITAIAWSTAAPLTARGGQSRSEQRLQERVDEAHRREAEVLVRLADDARSGRVAADFGIEWRHDFLKAQPGTFVPFTVSIARADLDATHALMYVRAVRVGTPGASPASEGKASESAEGERFAFDAIFPVSLGAPAGESIRISRGFAVEPGDYEVYVTVRERPADPLATRSGRLKAAVLKRTLAVPDYWTDELSTSTVMLADRIDVLPRPLGPDESLERPYVIGLNDVKISTSSRFRKNRELIVVFVVYNPTVTADRRFDLQVDYHLFHRVPPGTSGGTAAPEDAPQAREGERYVTRTEPQRFNPSVLGPRVDPGAGHPVLAGQGILLSSFQEGDYRLGITITDLLSRKTLFRDVTFTVTGS